MKKLFVMIAYLLTLLACHFSKKDTVRSFIPGSYARFSDHQMRKEFDTLKIEPLSESGNNYRLLRSSSFQKKLDGQSFPWEEKKEEWTAIYDEEKKVLQETSKGKIISFVPQKNILLVGSTEYKKIK